MTTQSTKLFSFKAWYLWIFTALAFLGMDAQADALTIVSDDGPPHMFKDNDQGIDLDITREVLESLGHSVRFKYAPLDRANLLVERGQADAMVPVFYQKDRQNFYSSTPGIDYRPTVFTLKEDKQQLDTLLDLNPLSIATFQGATGYFGPDFVTISKEARVYKEFFDMARLPKLLYKKRFKAVVLDYYIFHYYRQTHGIDKALFKEHALIPSVHASVAFHSKRLRDSFNQALEGYIHKGKKQAVVRRYLSHD